MSKPLPRDGSRKHADKAYVTLASALVNLPLAVVKIIAGVLSQSLALVADGIHSASDVLGDTLMVGLARTAPDESGSAGIGSAVRRKTMAAALAAALILAVAAVLGGYGFCRLVSGVPVVPQGPLALGVASGALVVKQGLFWYGQRIASRVQAALTGPQAWHRGGDIVSSLIALVAIIGAMLGLPAMDALGAMAIALMLVVRGLRYVWRSMARPAVGSASVDALQIARDQLQDLSGVSAVRRLTRPMTTWRNAHAEIDVSVDPQLSLTEAQRIGWVLSQRLAGHVRRIDVRVAPDGLIDAEHACALPLREHILPELTLAWGHLLPAGAISRVALHYIDDAIDVDIYLPLAYARDDRSHQQDFRTAVARRPEIGQLRLFYTAAHVSDLSQD